MEDEDDTFIPTYPLPSKILCKVVDVELKAFPDSDEVFAEIVLLPDSECEGSTCRSTPQKIPANSFRKILTTCDASKHGGCFLPKSHVEKTFPPLDTSQDQSSQVLLAKDLHGETWIFQHVCRGDPKRHLLLANGWNKFATNKKLKPGDACIFMRGLNPRQIYIGVQHAVKIQKVCTDLPGSTMRLGVLVEAYGAMQTRTHFSVMYHPRMCASAFIVPYDKVMAALEVNYSPGMGFEMFDDGRENPEYLPKIFSGTITAKGDIDPARWPNSEWRCLKVRWDISSSGHALPPRVSPWEIQPLALDVLRQRSFISIDRKRSMPFETLFRDNPLTRTRGGLQSRGLTDTGSSSRQDGTNMDEDM